MYERQETRVFVIGAGIAGLAAADVLRDAGMAVTLFESAGDVGGRIRSIRFHGQDIECGAQFLLSGYRYVLPLLRRYQLGLRVREFTRRTALERGGRLHRVDFRRPWSLASSGLLSWRELTRMTIGGASLAWHGRAINPSHYASLSNLDDVEADHFCQRKLGVAASRYVVEAMVHGFFFHRLSGSSRALIAAMMKFGADQALTIMGGWQALPRAMAARLVVHTRAPVEAMLEKPDHVEVRVNGEWQRADLAVLATPASVSRELMAAATVPEQAVLRAEYAATVHIALALRTGWQPPPGVAGIYGALLAPAEDAVLAGLTLESERFPGSGSDSEVLSVMLRDEAARAMASYADAELIRAVMPSLERHFPDLRDAVVSAHIQRWSAAEPLSPVGRARAIACYRASLAPDRRVVLAGDYLGSPWTDGAAETGLWAAHHVLRRSAPEAIRAG